MHSVFGVVLIKFMDSCVKERNTDGHSRIENGRIERNIERYQIVVRMSVNFVDPLILRFLPVSKSARGTIDLVFLGVGQIAFGLATFELIPIASSAHRKTNMRDSLIN